MIKEYIGSVDTRHNLTKYTLTNNVEIILNEDEMEEFFKSSKLGNEIESLRAENQKVTYQKEHYKGLIKNFNSILVEMKASKNTQICKTAKSVYVLINCIKVPKLIQFNIK